MLIGGLEPVTLRRSASAQGDDPQFLAMTLLPGRGMNLFQVRALFPGLGEIDLLASPSLEDAQKELNGGGDDFPGDFMGVRSFSFGGAILLPFANRIRGRLLPDGRTIETSILNRTVHLPADWHGKLPGAEKCAMHGLILDSKFNVVDVTERHVTATLDAGDFGGRWLSKSLVFVDASLERESFTLTATARNVGDEALPVGIGWHPYFALPGGHREQVRLRLPARRRTLVNNYDDVFPTGRIEPVSCAGEPLGSRYFDDTFVDLEKTAQGYTVVEILDPEANYGVRLTALSPEVKALQVYAPPDKPFVVVEPQFNWPDPFSPVWSPGTDTGMVALNPGDQVEWKVRCELFVHSG